MTNIHEARQNPTINICTYNILAGGSNRLEQVLRCIKIMNIDIAVLTETKLQDNKHTTNCEDYTIVSTNAISKYQGGVALCYRTSKDYCIEGTRTFGPNVIQTTLVSGKKRWRIVGAYIPPSETNGETLDFIQAGTTTTSKIPLILLGDFNVNISTNANHQLNDRQMETIGIISTLGLYNLNQHFKQRRNWGNWTWSMRREGKRITSTCDYILSSNLEDFKSFKLKEPRYFESDHRMLIGKIEIETTKNHQKYVKK